MPGYKRKVGENKWRLEYQLDCEKYSKNVKAKNDKEADKLLALFIAEIENGTYRKDSAYTFVEFAQLFLDKYAKSNLSDTTLREYKCRLNKYILKEFGQMNLSKIKRLQIQEFANKLIEEYNLSTKSANNYIKLISSILNKAVEWDFLQYNVADKVKVPKNLSKTKKKVILYSYEETTKFLEKLENLEDKELQLAIYTSFYTGARRGEVLGLQFKDINFKNGSIDINKNKVAIAGGTKIKDIKNGKNRLFYVPSKYIKIVKEYYKFLGKPNEDTFIFKMHPDTFSSHFKDFLKANSLRDINLKDLRALNESILVNKGIDIVLAAKRLGHLPSTSINYYLDQIPEEDKKARDILEEIS